MQDVLATVLGHAQALLVVLMRLEVMALTLATLVGFSVSLTIHWLQRRRSKVLPFLPSYQDSADQEHDAATRFFAAVHDLTMCVTEAWNTKHGRRKNAGSVESNISQHQLRQACEGVKTHGQVMMDGLEDYQALSNQMASAEGSLASAWSYTSTDNYRTEYYTETSVDSEGNTTRKTKSRRVYEDTDHWFTFDAAEAQRANRTIEALAPARGAARLVPPNIARMRVRVDNLSQADRMFLEKLYIHTIVEDPKAQPTEEELAACVNQWLLGTRIDSDLQSCEQHMDDALQSSDGAFATIHESRASYHYNTGSRSHSGPLGYQAAARLRGILSEATSSWIRVSAMWETCSSAAEELLEWAQDADEVEPDKDYARTAVDAYEAAFPDSALELDQLTTPGWTTLIGFAIAVVVGLMVLLFHPDGLLS
jgi:hypothetical protein